MNKKILISLSVIGVAAAIAIGGTVAFFSDTETSTGNTFTAGSIDLKIDNVSYLNGQPNPETSWTLRDLTIEKFFDFADLKPGDWGEDTVSLRVVNNPAWVCANIKLTSSADNGLNNPEAKAGDTTDNNWRGELDSELQFIFWIDDEDNVLESGEQVILSGTPADLPQGEGNPGKTFVIADSQSSIFEGPMPGDTTVYIGKAWCFGELTEIPFPAEEYTSIQPGNFICNGQPVTNVSQTDSLTADISFSAIQSKNNGSYVCPSIEPQSTNLLLTSVCSNDPTQTRRWRVTNYNNLPIDFTWDIYGTSQNGAGTAAQNSDTYFQSTTEGGNTARLFVGGIQVGVKASGGATCSPPIQVYP